MIRHRGRLRYFYTFTREKREREVLLNGVTQMNNSPPYSQPERTDGRTVVSTSGEVGVDDICNNHDNWLSLINLL
jgi:hypothetical protein